MSTSINRDFTVTHPIEEVKKNIDAVITNSKSTYQLSNKNDVFNTYTINLIGGIELVAINLQLKKISDTETQVILNSAEKIRNSGHEIHVNKIIDGFLNLVAKGLNGETITAEMVASGKAGCMVGALMIVGMGALSIAGIIYIFN
ncbi:MAG: hypothetical protein ACK5DE_00060 [Bacteroidota bacterium]|jgi:hypothetical protein